MSLYNIINLIFSFGLYKFDLFLYLIRLNNIF